MVELIIAAASVAEKLREWNDIRFFVFGMESAVLTFYLYYIGNFITKARKRKEYEMRNDLAYTWAAFFIFQSICNTLIMYADYFQNYLPSYDYRNYFLNLASVASLIGIILIARKAEQILRTHYVVTIMLSLIAVCPVIFYKFPTDYLNLFQTAAYICIILLFYAAVRYEIGNYRVILKQLKSFVYGFILFAISQLGRSDVSLNFFFNLEEDWMYNIRFFSDLGLVISVFLLQYSFSQFPSLFELEWKKYLKEIHIVHMKGGNEIYAYFFDEKNRENSEIVGGFMYGINQLVSEITGSNTALHMIKQQENVVCFEKNEQIIVVLIASDYKELYTHKLQQFLQHIMKEYGHLLPNWDGNRSHFKSLESLIQTYFK